MPGAAPLRKRGELDDNAALQDFADQLEAACFQTLDEGIMTKDLVGLCQDMTPTAVTTTQFISAIRERLEQALR